jgi:energy-coupling factor transporter ATP-binding protein EcfA2
LSERPLVSLRDVALGYGATSVLAGVDWDVRAGELWFLLGPNGAGKTTLLRALLGLLAPRAGSLDRDPARRARGADRGRTRQRRPRRPREALLLGALGRAAPARARGAGAGAPPSPAAPRRADREPRRRERGRLPRQRGAVSRAPRRVFVTHRLGVAARFASHVALACGGRWVAGPRAAVLADPLARGALGAALGRLVQGAAP